MSNSRSATSAISGLENYQSMAEQVPGNERIREGFANVLLDIVYEALRGRAEG